VSRQWLAVVVLAVAILVGTFTLGYVIGDRQPDCPTEDSCRPIYEDGSWQIVPVIP